MALGASVQPLTNSAANTRSRTISVAASRLTVRGPPEIQPRTWCGSSIGTSKIAAREAGKTFTGKLNERVQPASGELDWSSFGWVCVSCTERAARSEGATPGGVPVQAAFRTTVSRTLATSAHLSVAASSTSYISFHLMTSTGLVESSNSRPTHSPLMRSASSSIC